MQGAENIKASLENLGITVNIIKANDSQYKRYLENKNYDMILTGVYTPYSPDLTTYFGENNLANFNNQEAKNIIKEVNNITDEKLLKEKYNQLINIYKEEMPYIYLYTNRKTLVYSLNLLGEVTPNNYNIFYNIGSWYRQWTLGTFLKVHEVIIWWNGDFDKFRISVSIFYVIGNFEIYR